MASPPAQLTPPAVRTATTGPSSVPVLMLDWPNGAAVTIGSPSAASSVIDVNQDRIVELAGSASCWFAVGLNSISAGASGTSFLASGVTRYVYVPKGLKISVVQDFSGTALTNTLCIVPAIPGP